MLESILQDFRFALRSFRRSPGFTLAVLFTLALGIGANSAIYSVVDAALLHPVPFPEPDRLAALYQTQPQGGDENAVSYPNLLDWQQQSHAFEAIAGVRAEGFTLTGRGDPEVVPGLGVSSNLLTVLRVQPLLGRMFTAEEDRRGGRPVALLSEGLWKRRFGGDPRILGQSLNLDGREVEVIGVLPASVRLRAYFQEIFTPLGQNDNPFFYDRGSGDDTEGMGRLRAGVSFAQARAEMEAIMRNLMAQYPDKNYRAGVNVVSYMADKSGGLRPILIALSVAVGFVLLIACTNVANLVLARSSSRAQEFGIRAALGAGRGRMIRQLLTESVLLSLGGGALGLLIAFWYTQEAISILPSVLPVTSSLQMSQSLLWFSLALSLITSLLFGLAPAFKASDLKVQETLRQSGRSILGAHHRAQSILIVAEIALTLILIVGAGLMMRSLQKLWAASPGFRSQDLLVFHTSLSPQKFSTPAAVRRGFLELENRLRNVPGAESASVEIGTLPFMGNTTTGFSRADAPAGREQLRIANQNVVGLEYFRAMGIPLLRGRFFTAAEIDADQHVAVVDEELARATFPGQDALGKSIRSGLSGPPLEIVGIAGHVKHAGIDTDESAAVRAEVYYPLGQIPDSQLPGAISDVIGVIHSRVNSASLMSSIRKDLRSFNGDRAVSGEQTMTDVIADSFAPRRFSLVILGAFALVSLTLAIVGVYGVVSYVVSERTQEVGVRMALGAQPRDILVTVLQDGAILGGIGIALGLAGAAALTRLMGSMLYGVPPTDLLTFGSASILLLGFTLMACFVPAQRAALLSPLVAMGDQREANWRAARLKIRRAMQDAMQDMLSGGRESVVPVGSLISEFGASVRSAVSFPEAVRSALSILREQAGAQSILLLEKTEGGVFRNQDCSIPAQGFLIRRLTHYAHPLTLAKSDFEVLRRWAAEFKPECLDEIESLEHTGARIAVPLRTKTEMVGVLLLGPPEGREGYTAAEKKALESAAEVLALMLENSRLTGRAVEQEKVRRDLELAAEVQRRLLPPQPPSSGAVGLAGFTLPARTVGGDYYDFLELDGGRIGIAVADVSGKGIAAALLMSVVQASLRVISAEKGGNLSRLAERMNGFLHRSSGASKYATFFYAQVEASGGRMRFVNAGHNPPLFARKTGQGIEIKELEAGGPPLGLFPKMQFAEAEMDLRPGDVMIAFSDGVPEALNPAGEEFGEDRLKELLRCAMGGTAEEIASQLSVEVRDWAGGAEQHDDITIVVMKVQEHAGKGAEPPA